MLYQSYWKVLLLYLSMTTLTKTCFKALYLVYRKDADCSLVDNLIAKRLILPTFRPDAPVLLRARVTENSSGESLYYYYSTKICSLSLHPHNCQANTIHKGIVG